MLGCPCVSRRCSARHRRRESTGGHVMAFVHVYGAGRRDFLKAAGAAAAVAAFPAVVRAQAREVKVGYILPVTGPLAFEAALALNGSQRAVAGINAGGGVKSLGGAKLTLLPGDTQNKVCLLYTSDAADERSSVD